MATPILTIANQLTILRMGLAPLLIVLVLGGHLGWALAVFVVAGLTDLLDGLAARLGGQKTDLGAMLDPVADKVLLTACFIALTWGNGLLVEIPVWLTVTTLSRDAIIILSVAVINLAYGRRMFYPSRLGKLTTALQLVTVGVVILLNVLSVPGDSMLHLFALTLVLTVASALHYVYLASTGRTGHAPEPGAGEAR
jgi:cardiolipin synthase